MIGLKQKYQDLFFQTEQTVNRKKSGFRAPIWHNVGCERHKEKWIEGYNERN